jgi:hypothetical protein
MAKLNGNKRMDSGNVTYFDKNMRADSRPRQRLGIDSIRPEKQLEINRDLENSQSDKPDST